MPTYRKVLIVDDDRDARELFTFVLEDAGATVVLAEDGVTGLRAALERQPDLVLTDIAMPRMDGINMVRRLREQECTRQIPVVAVTAMSSRICRSGPARRDAPRLCPSPARLTRSSIL